MFKVISTVNMKLSLIYFRFFDARLNIIIDNTITRFNLHITYSTAGEALGQPTLSLFKGRCRSFFVISYVIHEPRIQAMQG